MALRFHERHALQTILDMVQSELQGLGWGNAALDPSDPINSVINFGATPATYQKALPDILGKAAVVPNTVAVTFGSAGPDADYELGAYQKDEAGLYGLHVVEIPVFIDVFGEKAEIADSLAGDIKTLFARKHRWLTINDYTASQDGTPSDEQIEFDNVTGPEEPPAAGVGPDFRRNWRIVKAMACLEFNPQD